MMPRFLRRPGRMRHARLHPGVRAGALPDEQLVAGVGDYEIDVLIRRLPGDRVEIVGQVTGAERVHEPVPGLALRIYDTDAMACVARTTTDVFGEFHVGGLPETRYVLALGETRDAPCLLVHEGGSHAAPRKHHL